MPLSPHLTLQLPNAYEAPLNEWYTEQLDYSPAHNTTTWISMPKIYRNIWTTTRLFTATHAVVATIYRGNGLQRSCLGNNGDNRTIFLGDSAGTAIDAIYFYLFAILQTWSSVKLLFLSQCELKRSRFAKVLVKKDCGLNHLSKDFEMAIVCIHFIM